MTSEYSTNYIDSNLNTKYFLETDKNQRPLQKQVPKTYQTYTGTGNETLAYNGSDVLIINTTLAAGVLTIDFTQNKNLYGKTLEMIMLQPALNNIVFNYAPGQLYAPGVAAAPTQTLPLGVGPILVHFNFFDIDKAIGCAWDLPTGVFSHETSLTFQISTNGLNELNTALGQPVIWDTTTGQNDSNLTLNGPVPNTVNIFTVTQQGKYQITYDIEGIGSLASNLGASILINAAAVTEMDATQGLTGQFLHGEVVMNLNVNDTIAIECKNVSGPNSGVNSFIPINVLQGRINIVRY